MKECGINCTRVKFLQGKSETDIQIDNTRMSKNAADLWKNPGQSSEFQFEVDQIMAAMVTTNPEEKADVYSKLVAELKEKMIDLLERLEKSYNTED